MKTIAIKNGKEVQPSNKNLPRKYRYDGKGIDKLILYTEISSLSDCEEMIDFFTILKASFYNLKNSNSMFGGE